ncbi:MAG: response regulator [Elusimicrobia bacterium]|nr:response regulator [Elusimicrobiota bacterium]
MKAENTDRPVVVMVDDDADWQTVVKGWLSERYEHFSLLDGNDLLEELAALEADLLILDVQMPGDDGFSVCRRLRADRRFDAMPIVFLTGRKEDADFLKNIDVGGTAFLTKPISRRRLLSVLRELLPDHVETLGAGD